MHLRALALSLLVICVTASVGCQEATPAQASPETAVNAFYSLRIASRTQGTPSVEQLEQLAPHISEELRALLEQALLQHHRIASRTVQSQRTFVEGDLFSSLFDGPTSFVAQGTEHRPSGEYMVSVLLKSSYQLPILSWTDRVKVIQENGRYVVADIEYANHWAFGSNTALVASLNSAIGKGARKHG
jgi:hypothetical protein